MHEQIVKVSLRASHPLDWRGGAINEHSAACDVERYAGIKRLVTDNRENDDSSEIGFKCLARQVSHN